MKRAEHMARHARLHQKLDELVADFIEQTGKYPTKTTIYELMEWSFSQVKNPTGGEDE